MRGEDGRNPGLGRERLSEEGGERREAQEKLSIRSADCGLEPDFGKKKRTDRKKGRRRGEGPEVGKEGQEGKSGRGASLAWRLARLGWL